MVGAASGDRALSTLPADVSLVARARGGDLPALAQLLDRHREDLRRLCRHLLQDVDAADDVVQEAMIVATLDLDRLERPDRFGAWLAGIARNLCRRRYRSSRQEWSWEAMLGGRLAAEPADPGPGPEEAAVRAEAAHSIRRAVARLPDGQREAVRLHYLDELSYREVADTLEIDVAAVKARLHRARAALRPALSPPSPRMEPTTMTTTPDVVAVTITDVRRSADDDRHVVLLDTSDDRRLPIWIGPFEASALAISLRSTPTPRPFSFPLMAHLVAALDGHVREVVVNALVDGTFYAEVVLDHPVGGEQRVDARPSDALNLATVVGAPVRVATAVLDALEPPPASYPDDFTTAFPKGAADIVAELQVAWERAQREWQQEREGDAG